MYSDKHEADYSEENKSEYHSPRDGRLISAVVALIFILGVFSVSGLHLLTDDREFSQNENRVLASLPKFSLSSIADGSLMRDFETYLTDQFPFRDSLISLKTLSDRVVGKNEENGVYIGKDDFLFEAPSAYDEEKVKEITDAVLKFSKKNKSLKKVFLLAPNSSYIYSDKLPDYLELPSQGEQISEIYGLLKKDKSIKKIDICGLFEKSKDTDDYLLYYKTDHHWTTKAAKKVFNALNNKGYLANDSGYYMSAKNKPDYEFYTVSTSFQGTLASTAGVHDTSDKIEICMPKGSQGTYVANFESSGYKTASLFFKDKLEVKNHYEVFLGGNYDKVVITTVSESDNALLLIKDSYANCMIPMLTPYFSKIVVVDPRYLTDSLQSIIAENDFSHVMFLYNLNTLLEDTSLVPCLES